MQLLALLALAALTAAADGRPRAITDDDVVVRVSWNEAILRRMAGLPLDARQTRMLAVLEREGRPVEPFPEGSPERENAARAEREAVAARRALAGWDEATLRSILERQKTTINALWPLTPGGGTQPPPPPPREAAQPPPEKTPGEAPDSESAPEPSQGLFEGAPPELFAPPAGDGSASVAPPPPDAAVAQAARSAAKALAGTGPGVFGPERKDDLPGGAPGAPRGARAPDDARPKAAGARTPPPPGPPSAEPAESPGEPKTEDLRRPAAAAPEPPSPLSQPAASSPPDPRLASTVRPGRASERRERTRRRTGAAGTEAALSTEELDALREIQSMLAQASGYDPLDSQALSDDAGALEAAGPVEVEGIDVAALRDQIDEILRLAGRQGLTLSEKEVIYAAARNLGLSTSQVQRIIRAVRLTEPPAPRPRERSWWRRLLAKLRREWRRLDARLHGR